MSNGQQVNHMARKIHAVDDPVIAHSQTVSFIVTFHALLRIRSQPETHFIQFALDSFLDGTGQREKVAVKLGVGNLRRRAHDCMGSR
jgi:hypothetical protein